MKYTKLGKRGPEISTIGFGSWGISGRDWGKTDDKNSIKALHTALDEGVNFIDTADVYGFGHSEELIRQVLSERKDRDKIVLATKAGNNFYPYINKDLKVSPLNHDYSEKHLIHAAEESLKRLNTECLDILQLHSPPTDILERDEPWEALTRLKSDGKIRHAGWSVQSFRESEQTHILERHNELIDVIQVRYNLLEREAEEKLFPAAMKYGTGVIVRIPLLFGLLTGKFDKNSTFGEDDHRKLNLAPEKLRAYIDRMDTFNDFFRVYSNYSPAQLSLGFCISHPACHVAIPSGKTPAQVRENTAVPDSDKIPYKAYPKLKL